MMDLENTKMESYAVNDLIDHLMAFLHETYEKEPMGMVIDCDVNEIGRASCRERV